ncbi:hypothetical protein PFISCL1PPCAC_16400, partial [Pristionchus fissidentatus]
GLFFSPASTMGKAQRKNRKKMTKVDASTLRDRSVNLYKDTPATHNRDPENAGDAQETPKAVREMLRRIEEGKKQKKGGGVVKRTFPKKKGPVENTLAAAGIEKKGKESINRAVARMHDTVNKELTEMRIKAKAGVAGKDTKQIVKEYKDMDEAARSKREAKLLKRKKEEEMIHGKARDKTVKRLKAIEEERIRDGSKAGRKKMNKVGREREKRKMERQVMEKEAMLDAKEVIDFGERYDAPPSFKGALKTRIDPLTAKAGAKSTLLVHSLLGEKRKRSEDVAVTDIPTSETGAKKEKKEPMTALMLAERQRIIDAYRKGKREKNGGLVGVRALKDTIDL